MAKRKPKTYKAVSYATGKVIHLSADRAGELMIGGLVGILGLADQMKFSTKSTAALFGVLKEAVYHATPAALVAVYDRLGKDKLPADIRRAVLVKPNGARKPTGTRARPRAARSPSARAARS